MLNIKDLSNFYVITNSNEDFIKAKLILESYFKSCIKPNLSYYHSRILLVDKNKELTCYSRNFDYFKDAIEVSLDDLIKYC